MYFNRKNSQQKNWRMIKKGKHFLFGCALVFTLGATANVASAETIVSEVTTVDQAQDSTAASEDADSEAAASTTAVSEVASSTTATSEAASETASTSTVASSETTSTASEAATSENSESASVASSEAASSETASSTTVEAVSEVSTTVSASETANVARTAYIGYEVQYTTSSGEVVAKTANIVAADTTEAVATSTLTVAATDVPAGYELATEQAYSLTQQISENQMNILSFAVVKKSEEEEIAESQLANKTVLEQVLSEATLLSEEALRLVATTQAGNITLEAAATATQETADKATLVFEDAAATQEQVDSQVEAVKASTLALAEEMLKVDEDGNLTVALSDSISASTNGLVPSNYITTNYEVKDGYVYWTHILNSGFINKDNYSYSFTLPKAVGEMEDVVMQRIDRNNNVVETKTTWTNKSGDEESNGMQFVKDINDGSAGALYFDRQNQIKAAIDRTGFKGSNEILANSQPNYYGIKTDSNVNNNYKYKVTFKTKIVDETLPLDYVVTGNPATKLQGANVVAGQYNTQINESPAVSTIGSDGTQLYPDRPTDKYLFVFGTTEGTTETETGTPNAAPGFNKDNAVAVTTITDADGINRISYDDASVVENPQSSLGSNLILGTDGKLEGTLTDLAGGFYSRRVIVTDNAGSITKSNVFFTYSYTDKKVDETPIEKEEGIAVAESEIFAKLAIATTSDTFPNTDKNVPTVPDTEYTRTVVGYRPVGSTAVTDATVDALPTTGEYEVRVKTTNIYGQEIYNWVTVNYAEPANQAPTVTVNSTATNVPIGDGSVPNAIFVFGTNQGTTEDINGATGTSPVADPTKATQKVAEIADPDGTVDSIVYHDTKNTRFDLASSTDPDVNNPNDALLVNTDGYLTGHLIYGPGAKSTRRLDVTDNSGVTTNSNTFMVLGYTDKVADTTPVAKVNGIQPTEAEILAKLDIDVNSAYPNAVPSDLEIPTSQYTREIVGYRLVGSTDTVASDAAGLPTTGDYDVRVKTTNIYGQEIFNWVRVDHDDNQLPTVTVNSTPTNVQINDGSVPNAIFVFGTNQGTTEDINGATGTSPVADPTKATQKVAEIADPDGTVDSIVYHDTKNTRFDLASSTDPDVNNPNDALLVNTDGYLTGHLIYGPGAKSTRRLDVTDNSGVTTNSNTFMVLGYTDKVADATAIAKEEGVNVTADEIYSKLAIDVNSSYPNAVPSTLVIPADQYTREIVGYRTVSTSGTTVTKGATTEATASTLPTSGTYEVRVKTTNIYGQEIYNWVTVKYTDTTAPESPSVVANEDGTVTVTPSQTAGDDTKTTDITYTDENGTEQTVTVTKADDGTWSVPADSGLKVADPSTGAVTIPADKVQDGSTVSAVSKDEAGNTSNPSTDKAKNDPTPADTTAPEAPTVKTNDDGSVTVTPSTTAGDDTKTVEITYTDEDGTKKTVPITKGEDGNWTVPTDSGVTVDPTTGAVTIPADKVQDGSPVSAVS
ncbi:hypothetical protein ACTGWZ_01985, partial [Streptococcus suis]